MDSLYLYRYHVDVFNCNRILLPTTYNSNSCQIVRKDESLQFLYQSEEIFGWAKMQFSYTSRNDVTVNGISSRASFFTYNSKSKYFLPQSSEKIILIHNEKNMLPSTIKMLIPILGIIYFTSYHDYHLHFIIRRHPFYFQFWMIMTVHHFDAQPPGKF